MIRRSTAFILGAGTSVPYGFPAGEALLRQARGFDLANLNNKLYAPVGAKELFAALQRTHDASLDTMLELRPDITESGKRLIASLILELEHHSADPARFPVPKDDWLTTFFGELVSKTKCLKDFAKNPGHDSLRAVRKVAALRNERRNGERRRPARKSQKI